MLTVEQLGRFICDKSVPHMGEVIHGRNFYHDENLWYISGTTGSCHSSALLVTIVTTPR